MKVRVYATDIKTAELTADKPDGKLGIINTFIFCTKEFDELIWKQQENDRRNKVHNSFRRQQGTHGKTGPSVGTDNWI